VSSSGPVEAALALGAAHGIRAAEGRILKDGSNLLVHLWPAPVVVRVATFTGRIRRDPEPCLAREVAIVTALAEVGAPVVPPSPLLPAGPHRIDGWTMTALAFVEAEASAVPDAAATLRALDELHAALRSIHVDLPLLGPAMADLDLAVAFATRHGLLAAGEAHEVRRRRDVVAGDLLAATADRQALHGDAFPRNALVVGGRVVWLDFEDSCLGPPAWDHAILVRDTGDPAVRRILADRDGAAVLDLAIELRGLQARVWRTLHDARRAGLLDGDR
jgi:hypothetical protein